MKRSEAEVIRARIANELDDVVTAMFREFQAPPQALARWESKWKEEANLAVMRVLSAQITERD